MHDKFEPRKQLQSVVNMGKIKTAKCVKWVSRGHFVISQLPQTPPIVTTRPITPSGFVYSQHDVNWLSYFDLLLTGKFTIDISTNNNNIAMTTCCYDVIT